MAVPDAAMLEGRGQWSAELHLTGEVLVLYEPWGGGVGSAI
jgi:hypothetical protein